MSKTKLKKLTPERIVLLIAKAYKARKGVFVKLVNAENHIPKNTTPRQKTLFLFYVIQLDYATKSQRLYQGAKDMWHYNKKYFTPEVIIKTSNSEMKGMLNKYLKPRYINEAVKRWKINSAKLLDYYKGDPVNIFRDTNYAKEVMKRIGKFRGFGPKIGNFFFRSMVNTFNFKLKNLEEISQPVDVHDIRLTYEWGFINSKRMTPKNIRRVKDIWQEACKKAKISWLIFDRALWILGSEGVRTNNPIKDITINLGFPKADGKILTTNS